MQLLNRNETVMTLTQPQGTNSICKTGRFTPTYRSSILLVGGGEAVGGGFLFMVGSEVGL